MHHLREHRMGCNREGVRLSYLCERNTLGDDAGGGVSSAGFVVEFSVSEASLGSGLGLVEVAPDRLGGFARDYGGK